MEPNNCWNDKSVNETILNGLKLAIAVDYFQTNEFGMNCVFKVRLYSILKLYLIHEYT